MSFFSGDQIKAKLAASVLLTITGYTFRILWRGNWDDG